MIGERRVLAVCPARGGSKGIPRKNLQLFAGVPLVSHVGHLVSRIALIDRAVVSTDDPEIAEVAAEAGLAAPFLRPEALSGDRVGDVDVLIHALEESERIDGVSYDVVVMLQPTSPLRRDEHVIRAIEMLVEGNGNWDAVWTVSETDSKSHPLKQLQVDGQRLDYYDTEGKQVIARQQLAPVHHRNGVAYAITRNCLLEQRSIKGERTGALVLEDLLVSIDTPFDLELAEFIYQRQRRTDQRF